MRTKQKAAGAFLPLASDFSCATMPVSQAMPRLLARFGQPLAGVESTCKGRFMRLDTN
jgi:hypothetical protein